MEGVSSIDQLDARVDVACAVIADYGVPQVELVVNQRLAPGEYQRLRLRASASRVDLRLSGDGFLRLQSGLPTNQPHQAAPPERRSWLDQLRRWVPRQTVLNIDGGVE